MKYSYQSGTKFDQTSSQVENGRETETLLEQGGCAFLARTTPDHNSYSFNKLREMITNLITHLKEEAPEDAEHKGWCNTELTTNTQTRKAKDHKRGKTLRYCGRVRCFAGEFGNESGETLRTGVSSSRQRSLRGSEEIDPRPDLEATAEISQKG